MVCFWKNLLLSWRCSNFLSSKTLEQSLLNDYLHAFFAHYFFDSRQFFVVRPRIRTAIKFQQRLQFFSLQFPSCEVFLKIEPRIYDTRISKYQPLFKVDLHFTKSKKVEDLYFILSDLQKKVSLAFSDFKVGACHFENIYSDKMGLFWASVINFYIYKNIFIM